MFGYIKTVRAELRVREYEYYRSAYCGLCLSMGKCTGQCSRLTLSYDFAFLALVRMALVGTKPRFCERRCVAHPFRRRRMMVPHEELELCARAAAILSFEKCRDDVADERGFARFRARLRCLFLKGAYRRAKKELPELTLFVREKLTELQRIEKEKTASVDLPASVFGDLLSGIVSFGLEGGIAKTAAAIGRHVGKFIYIADAVDDLPRDVKSGSYNPLRLLFGDTLTAEQKETVEVALVAGLTELESALDLIEAPDQSIGAILKNILYLGMPATVKRVLYGDGTDEKKEKPL